MLCSTHSLSLCSTTGIPRLRHYSGLRPFLNDLFWYQRKKDRKYSRAAFARKLGVSATTLRRFLDGDHMLSEASLERVGASLEWNSRQKDLAMNLRKNDQMYYEPSSPKLILLR